MPLYVAGPGAPSVFNCVSFFSLDFFIAEVAIGSITFFLPTDKIVIKILI